MAGRSLARGRTARPGGTQRRRATRADARRPAAARRPSSSSCLAEAQLLGNDGVRGADDERRRPHRQQLGCAAGGWHDAPRPGAPSRPSGAPGAARSRCPSSAATSGSMSPMRRMGWRLAVTPVSPLEQPAGRRPARPSTRPPGPGPGRRSSWSSRTPAAGHRCGAPGGRGGRDPARRRRRRAAAAVAARRPLVSRSSWASLKARIAVRCWPREANVDSSRPSSSKATSSRCGPISVAPFHISFSRVSIETPAQRVRVSSRHPRRRRWSGSASVSGSSPGGDLRVCASDSGPASWASASRRQSTMRAALLDDRPRPSRAARPAPPCSSRIARSRLLRWVRARRVGGHRGAPPRAPSGPPACRATLRRQRRASRRRAACPRARRGRPAAPRARADGRRATPLTMTRLRPPPRAGPGDRPPRALSPPDWPEPRASSRANRRPRRSARRPRWPGASWPCASTTSASSRLVLPVGVRADDHLRPARESRPPASA